MKKIIIVTALTTLLSTSLGAMDLINYELYKTKEAQLWTAENQMAKSLTYISDRVRENTSEEVVLVTGVASLVATTWACYDYYAKYLQE